MSTDSLHDVHQAIDERLNQLQILISCRATSTHQYNQQQINQLQSVLNETQGDVDHLSDAIGQQEIHIKQLEQIKSALMSSAFNHLITEQQLETLPGEYRRNINLSDIDQYYQEIRQLFRNKYLLLSKPRSSLTSQEAIECEQYHRQEQKQTVGQRFITLNECGEKSHLINALVYMKKLYLIAGTSPACYCITSPISSNF